TLESIGDAIISTDTEGYITHLNAVAESLTGWKSSEAEGLPLGQVFHIIHESSQQAVDNLALRVLLGEGTVARGVNHTLLISKEGTQRPLDYSVAPIQDDQGRVVGHVLVFRDI